MAFVIIMILLCLMGLWVLYQLLRIHRARKAKAPAIDMRASHPVLYWIIIGAQSLFLIACLYSLYGLFHKIIP